MVEALHGILQSGRPDCAIRRGLFPGHHGIHAAVAENKQHPLVHGLRRNLRDLLMNLLAQGVTFALLTKGVGNHANFCLDCRQVVAARYVDHLNLILFNLFQHQRGLRLGAGQHQRRPQGEDPLGVQLADIAHIRQALRGGRPGAGAVFCHQLPLGVEGVNHLRDVAAERHNPLGGGAGQQRKRRK